MKLTIHDVGAGGCITLLHENGNCMMWDCGKNEGNQPSRILRSRGVTEIQHFFVTNYDEDHISDLPELRTAITVKSLYRNKSISGEQLRALKKESGPITNTMVSLLDMISSYTGGPLSPAPDFPNVSWKVFYLPYGEEYCDTNNISLVTFLQFGETKFIFPGDLENKGWEGLLNNPDFVGELNGVNVFVASHHGRENGYCSEVFDHCSPQVVVISDGEIKYATQEMVNTYAAHAAGIQFNGDTRYVLTTRRDGTITWG
ncbi:MAG: hypothetical protein U5R06_11690 [candidate division KSB1 bacterium]|nr:hypothetical protein [candidate division KSB1 bacterium]